jgi:hypothetical protein
LAHGKVVESTIYQNLAPPPLFSVMKDFLQALHKVIRRIREEKARLQNNEANLTDILTRSETYNYNSFVRCYIMKFGLSLSANQTNPTYFCFFALTRINVRSDCLVRFFEPELVCQVCDGEGHTHRACPLASSKVGENMSYQDYIFWCYVAPSDRLEEFVEF